jgi:hypothetical protein
LLQADALFNYLITLDYMKIDNSKKFTVRRHKRASN